ncbi:helix-turn-helix domain-containing protein [Actinoplanes sp. URMC 104]|uniref:helix-turn-helix domain-containing protein n=1 Tax=Actinoplanes sp. URMC 104 TaxID=3423409 RepID=UPI003F1ABC9A
MIDASGATALTFTTRGLAVASRGPVLCALLERGLLPVEPLPGRTPAVELTKWRLPGASVLWASFAGVRQRGDPATAGPPGDLFFAVNLSGAGLVRQRGREVAVGAGEAVLIEVDGGPFTVLRPEPTRLIGLRVPRAGLGADAASAGPRLVPPSRPALGLLRRYLLAVRDDPMPRAGPLADAFAGHVGELIGLALRPDDGDARQAGAPSLRAARLSAVKADVARQLTDAGLSAARVAGRQGITVRYLHKLFEREPQTFAQFVLGRRLELAHRRLGDPRWAGRTVSAIAHDSGFGDLSGFNRAFRHRYGVTPSEVREAAARAGG